MNDNNLVHLTYVSAAAHGLMEEQLVEILSEARERNLRRAITGMLLYRDGRFMQVLEGHPEDVEHVFGLIKKDDRHVGVVQTLYEEIESRDFPNWTMGFDQIPKGEEPEGFVRVSPDNVDSIFQRAKVEKSLAIRVLRTFASPKQMPDIDPDDPDFPIR